MNISKRYKKEKARLIRNFLVSIVIMVLMPYMVIILNEQGIFSVWEYHFALAYAILVDLLLLIHLVKSFNEIRIGFAVYGRKLKIKDSIFRLNYSLPLEKIVYIDVIEKKNKDFDLFILLKKGKKNKRFINFNIGYVKKHMQFKNIYDHFNDNNEVVDYQCVFINRGGAKKFYLLYVIFKNAYNAELSPKALDYVKKFMEEYNMS